MIQNKSSNSQYNAIGNKARAILNKFEWLVVVVVFVGYFIKTGKVHGGGAVLALGLLSLAVLYFYAAFATVAEGISLIDQFLNKLLFFTWSLCSVVVLLFVMQWPSTKIIVILSIFLLMFCVVILVIVKQKNANSFILNKVYNMRTAAFFVFSLFAMAAFYSK